MLNAAHRTQSRSLRLDDSVLFYFYRYVLRVALIYVGHRGLLVANKRVSECKTPANFISHLFSLSIFLCVAVKHATWDALSVVIISTPQLWRRPEAHGMCLKRRVLLTRTLQKLQSNSAEELVLHGFNGYNTGRLFFLSSWTKKQNKGKVIRSKKRNKSSHLLKHSTEVEPTVSITFRGRRWRRGEKPRKAVSTVKFISLDMREPGSERRNRGAGAENVKGLVWGSNRGSSSHHDLQIISSPERSPRSDRHSRSFSSCVMEKALRETKPNPGFP